MASPGVDVDGYTAESLDHLRHELKSPLTTVSGRAQLLARAIQRSPSLAEGEREKLLASLREIDAAVHRLVTVIDGLEHQPEDTHPS